MKKVLKTALCLLLLAVAGIAVYRFAFRKSIPDVPAAQQVRAILEQNDCFVCHSQTPQIPLAKLPVIGKMMEQDAYYALRFTDLDAKVVENIDEVTLSMLDHAASYGQMPPHKYRMMHWGTGFTNKEKSVILGYVKDLRGSEEPVCVIPESVDHNSARAELGQRLFNDTRLSLDGTISCATCHVLENGGADHADERVSEGINGLTGGVNAPTVYNAGFQTRQFWNGRAADLREQAEGPSTNPVEMGDQTLEQIVERLSRDKSLVKEFELLYPGEGLTPMTLTSAIAEFETTLITPGSRFDKWLSGDSAALSEEEIKGYGLFKEYACATCHTGLVLGGQSFEYLPVYGDYFADRREDIEYNSDDEGLKGFSGRDEDLHKFKVPMLRNIELTAPYFHDGSYQTLEEAVAAMGKYELGKKLGDSDIAAMVAFMKTLTGKNKHLN